MPTNSSANTPTGTAGTVLQGQGANVALELSTATYPSTTTINQVLYSSAANTVTGLATANRAVLTTGATGVPVLTALATDGQLIIGSTAGVPAAATLTAGSGVTITNASNSITIAANGASPTTGVVNLGITLSGGTFTVTSASGSALSASNVAYVTLQGKTAGVVKTIAITTNQTFIDDVGASTIIGNLFGLTTGVAYAQDVPFFIYAVLNDAENAISFMISRYAGTVVSPVAAKIGKTGSAVADTQGSFFALSNPTVADYESNPCLMIGSIRMRMSAADDWTVQALSTNDGIGEFNDNTTFSCATGGFGAAAGSFFKNNGGAAPTFTAQGLNYHIAKDGKVHGQAAMTTCNSSGTGAVTLQIALPYTITNGSIVGSGYDFISAGPVYLIVTLELLGSNSNTGRYVYTGSFNGVLLNTDMSVVNANSITHNFTYYPEFV